MNSNWLSGCIACPLSENRCDGSMPVESKLHFGSRVCFVRARVEGEDLDDSDGRAIMKIATACGLEERDYSVIPLTRCPSDDYTEDIERCLQTCSQYSALEKNALQPSVIVVIGDLAASTYHGSLKKGVPLKRLIWPSILTSIFWIDDPTKVLAKMVTKEEYISQVKSLKKVIQEALYIPASFKEEIKNPKRGGYEYRRWPIIPIPGRKPHLDWVDDLELKRPGVPGSRKHKGKKP